MPTLNEIEHNNPPEWLAVRITEKDPSSREPIAGEVVARASDGEEIFEKIDDFVGEELYIFFNGPAFEEGYVAAF